MKNSPAGNLSLTTTPVASLGPLLVAVIVKVTLAPTFGVVLSTPLVMAMSAATGLMLALAVLLPATGSVCNSAVLVAVLVVGDVVFTLATMERVLLAPLARVPTVQSPVAELYGPLGAAETKDSPAGIRSFTTTPVALLGPLFFAVTVKVTLVPKPGVGFDTVLV